MNYDFWNEQAYGPLVEFEEQVLAAMEQMMKEANAPAGSLPFMLRHMHKTLEERYRQEAKKVTLQLGMPPELQDRFMAEVYPDLLKEAKEEGFEEVGQYMSFQAMMGCARPMTREQFDQEREERESNP
jgi:hypothetical protein